jgi:medium-chain acyl-[acyl-carrier-protein] hydrolase
MIEAAWAHAQVMDWGYDTLKSSNLFWVLSRMYIQIERYPLWQESINLSTWSAGTDGMYAYREYIFEDEQGKVVMRASTAWLILDMENHKIFRLTEYRSTFPKLINSEACRNPKRIKPLEHPEHLQYFPVLYSELDINQHLNSVKYLERAIDQFGIDYLNRFEANELEINYLKEAMAGDFIAVNQTQIFENETLSCLVRESDKADLCAISIKWQKRQNSNEIMDC